MTFHPWRRLRDLTHVRLEWQDVDHELGCADPDTATVTITEGMTQAERRSTLTHELIHLERGSAVEERHKLIEERHVRREAARRLITLDALVDALRWSWDEHELAEELWTDPETVLTRLRNLSVAERRFIDAELDRKEAEAEMNEDELLETLRAEADAGRVTRCRGPREPSPAELAQDAMEMGSQDPDDWA